MKRRITRPEGESGVPNVVAAEDSHSPVAQGRQSFRTPPYWEERAMGVGPGAVLSGRSENEWQEYSLPSAELRKKGFAAKREWNEL